MNTWDHLAEQAHRLLTRPRRADLTPAVTLIRSLHKQAPESPAAICAHLETATTVLPQLARYSRGGVLRRRAPEWLGGMALRGVVAGISEAHRRHGGEGALYVALKRKPRG